MKTLLILAIGLAIGYGLGFKDARAHDRTIVSRMLDRVGGSNRGKYGTDVNQQMQEAERR